MDTLCTSTSAPALADRTTEVKIDGAPPRGVLVVDDDASIRMLLDVALRQRGFIVWMASNGEEALDVYRIYRHEISLVLLDVRMPVLDGPQAVAALRRLDPALTFCFMSGNSGSYAPEELMELGAACVFEKPFSVARVLQTVEHLTASTTLVKH